MSTEPRSANPTLSEPTGGEAKRRARLAAFLKACRAKMSPEAAGLPDRPRRRSPGLSRLEVASLAGISVDWYTWLEQSRDVRPSTQVLDSLAEALQLTEPERRYLRALAEHSTPPTENPDADISLAARLIAQLTDAPAFVLDRNWRILAQNGRAKEVFGTWSGLTPEERNILHLFFTQPIFIEYLRGWERHARLAIRQFRAARATDSEREASALLIQRLRAASPQFAEWWQGEDVAGRDDGRKEFDHPSLGYLDYDYTILRPAENHALEVIVFVPRLTRVESL